MKLYSIVAPGQATDSQLQEARGDLTGGETSAPETAQTPNDDDWDATSQPADQSIETEPKKEPVSTCFLNRSIHSLFFGDIS